MRHRKRLHWRFDWSPSAAKLKNTEKKLGKLCVTHQNFMRYILYKESQEYRYNKGQIKPKAVWMCRRFSQKMNEQIYFVCHEKPKSKQNKFVCLFVGRIYERQSAFGFI